MHKFPIRIEVQGYSICLSLEAARDLADDLDDALCELDGGDDCEALDAIYQDGFDAGLGCAFEIEKRVHLN
jgi:hypothetical protein